jgi:hypothetical protein
MAGWSCAGAAVALAVTRGLRGGPASRVRWPAGRGVGTAPPLVKVARPGTFDRLAPGAVLLAGHEPLVMVLAVQAEPAGHAAACEPRDTCLTSALARPAGILFA